MMLIVIEIGMIGKYRCKFQDHVDTPATQIVFKYTKFRSNCSLKNKCNI